MNKQGLNGVYRIHPGETDIQGYTYHYINDPSGTIWFKTADNPGNDLPNTVWSSGRREWHPNTMLHRLTGPAVITELGARLWFVHGQNITPQVEQWMQANHYSLPFTEDQQMEFTLKFG